VGGPATLAAWDGVTPAEDGLPVLGGGAPLPVCRLTLRRGVVLYDAGT
jgi:hypothetical protein